MKLADVRVGERYMTRVCGLLLCVMVVRREGYMQGSRHTRFVVCSTGDEPTVLPCRRTAKALHPLTAKKECGTL